MTEQELDAIEAQAAAATPGPWSAKHGTFQEYHRAQNEFSVICHSYAGGGMDSFVSCSHKVGLSHPFEDSKFIAHAREDVPALIAEVRKLRAKPAWNPIEEAPLMVGIMFFQDMDFDGSPPPPFAGWLTEERQAYCMLTQEVRTATHWMWMPGGLSRTRGVE